MTHTSALPPPSSPLPVPTDQAVYLGLSTDHYPWTDLSVDLATRQSQGLSCVLDAQQDGRWARFVWLQGELLGGHTWGGQAVAWAATMQALPRATVSLTQQPPRVAQLIWAARSSAPVALDGVWPACRQILERELFSGLLIGGVAGSPPTASAWETGQLIGGTLPAAGAICQTTSPYSQFSVQAMTDFWKELLDTVSRSVPLDGVWREVSSRLCATYPCLDPFSQEIALRGDRLHIDPALSMGEIRPALLAALRASLTRVGVRLADLPVAELRTRPEWAAAGLETL